MIPALHTTRAESVDVNVNAAIWKQRDAISVLFYTLQN